MTPRDIERFWAFVNDEPPADADIKIAFDLFRDTIELGSIRIALAVMVRRLDEEVYSALAAIDPENANAVTQLARLRGIREGVRSFLTSLLEEAIQENFNE